MALAVDEFGNEMGGAEVTPYDRSVNEHDRRWTGEPVGHPERLHRWFPSRSTLDVDPVHRGRRSVRRAIDIALVLIVCFGLLASACGSRSEGSSATVSTDTSIPDGADEVRFSDDQIVWQTRTAGGLVPQVAWAAQRPSLTIYGDGRFFLVAPGSDQRFDDPIEIRFGTVERGDLAVFVAQAMASGLFDPDVTFAEPDEPDMSTTSVVLHGSGEPLTVSAYALGGRFDVGLSDAAVQQRETFRRLLASAQALQPDLESWTPDRIRVLHLPDDATFEPKPEADPEADPVAWPGADPETFALPGPDENGTTTVLGCTEATGTRAEELFRAAVDNPLPTWDVDGETRVIVVVALLPGEVACG